MNRISRVESNFRNIKHPKLINYINLLNKRLAILSAVPSFRFYHFLLNISVIIIVPLCQTYIYPQVHKRRFFFFKTPPSSAALDFNSQPKIESSWWYLHRKQIKYQMITLKNWVRCLVYFPTVVTKTFKTYCPCSRTSVLSNFTGPLKILLTPFIKKVNTWTW